MTVPIPRPCSSNDARPPGKPVHGHDDLTEKMLPTMVHIPPPESNSMSNSSSARLTPGCWHACSRSVAASRKGQPGSKTQHRKVFAHQRGDDIKTWVCLKVLPAVWFSVDIRSCQDCMARSA
ncbi:hypothetical protein BD289DRAFT_77703 [Coniella lustricola]|uniref:Uncharacterized protein n=1 Tax=Coniella lustricola TaxID=2025994 RepID=A0A2T2ZZE1_9PEZI|nr:hypothetical protein BD289DRAFT_77703 [Coniella lustricola]